MKAAVPNSHSDQTGAAHATRESAVRLRRHSPQWPAAIPRTNVRPRGVPVERAPDTTLLIESWPDSWSRGLSIAGCKIDAEGLRLKQRRVECLALHPSVRLKLVYLSPLPCAINRALACPCASAGDCGSVRIRPEPVEFIVREFDLPGRMSRQLSKFNCAETLAVERVFPRANDVRF